MSDEQGGRVFFSNVRRSLEFEDEITLTSVGVDIGSSTSHLVFSRLLLERLDNRYVVSERVVLHESEVLLTPCALDLAGEPAIDAAALRTFVDRQYELAKLTPEMIDSGALILTGVAVRRSNARAIGDLFAAQAGKFVAVSAGDALETTLAAFGSGAAALSIRDNQSVMNVDVGGGTSKIALCVAGAVVAQTAIDIGARIVAFDGAGRVARIEPAAALLATAVGLRLSVGEVPDAAGVARLVERMAEHLFDAMQCAAPAHTVRAEGSKPSTQDLLRLEPLQSAAPPDALCFSGGVSEYIYGRSSAEHGDLGAALAQAVLQRAKVWGPRLVTAEQGIRATVVGASQYTIQVSGSTIFVEPQNTLPLRNVPVITPALPLSDEALNVPAIAQAVEAALRRLDLHSGEQAVALCYRWLGSATWARLDALCQGLVSGLATVLQQGHPLVLVSDGDIGGLVGIHLHSELALQSAVVSIDGIVLQEFDYIDIGALLDTSGAVPVVIKSLVFPQTAGLGPRGRSAVRLAPSNCGF